MVVYKSKILQIINQFSVINLRLNVHLKEILGFLVKKLQLQRYNQKIKVLLIMILEALLH